MRTDTLRVLRTELAFAEEGGYFAPVQWRSRLVFEDSPTCPRGDADRCPRACPLLDFVPKAALRQPVPCRHIPFNALGETLDSLYRTGTNQEIERSLKEWLHRTITRLNAETDSADPDKAAA